MIKATESLALSSSVTQEDDICLSCIGEMRTAHKTLVEKSERMMLIHRWDNNIKMDLSE